MDQGGTPSHHMQVFMQLGAGSMLVGSRRPTAKRNGVVWTTITNNVHARWMIKTNGASRVIVWVLVHSNTGVTDKSRFAYVNFVPMKIIAIASIMCT